MFWCFFFLVVIFTTFRFVCVYVVFFVVIAAKTGFSINRLWGNTWMCAPHMRQQPKTAYRRKQQLELNNGGVAMHTSLSHSCVKNTMIYVCMYVCRCLCSCVKTRSWLHYVGQFGLPFGPSAFSRRRLSWLQLGSPFVYLPICNVLSTHRQLLYFLFYGT